MTYEQEVRLMMRLGKDARYLKLRDECEPLIIPFFKLRETLTQEQFELIMRYNVLTGEMEAIRTDLAYQMGREDAIPREYVFF